MRKLFFISLLMIIFNFADAQQQRKLKLPALVGDSMVLQQDARVQIWGWSVPGNKITITTGWDDKDYKTRTDRDGKWNLKVKTPHAGGPYDLKIASEDTTICIKELLVGEVWICSGQSNMAFTLSNSASAKEEAPKANNPKIRFFTVEQSIGVKPKEDLKGKWQGCTPETVREFSAVAYFFGKKIQEELSVPVGLINTSWGGTPVEAWTSRETIEDFDEFKITLEEIADITEEQYQVAMKKRDSILALQTRLINHDSTDNIGIAEGWMNEKIDDSDWKTISYPAEWSATDIGMFEGIMWSRKTIEIPKAWRGKKLTLELGPVDEMDATYFNGKKIGFHNEIADWDKDRIYSIPAAMVKAGKNVIAIRIANTYREGGLFGKPGQLKIYPAKKPKKVISLSGEWKYKIAYHFSDIPAQTNPRTPTFLYNGMIHPILNMEIRGAIWYQGENNASRAYQYRKLFPAMIEDWRKNWSQRNFSFYFVQLAPYNYGNEFIGAELREAQLLTIDEVKNTGMAVIMDIGNPDDIHPKNKRDVGYRLARWALAHDYDKEIVFSGPLYKTYKIENNKIRIFFKHTGSGLVAQGGELNSFEIAGEDQKFYKAIAEIDGNTVVVYSDKVPEPMAVRYAWKNYVKPNLFNKEGLPASSFATDKWKRVTQDAK